MSNNTSGVLINDATNQEIPNKTWENIDTGAVTNTGETNTGENTGTAGTPLSNKGGITPGGIEITLPFTVKLHCERQSDFYASRRDSSLVA